MVVTVCASGYVNPIHSGHIEYIRKSRELGDRLVFILNSDYQSKLKKGYTFMNENDRKIILEALRDVDEVVIAIDKDRSVCKTLEMIKPDIFCNGGDQNNKSIPEAEICNKLGIKMVDSLGYKIQSSSWIINAFLEKKHSKKPL